jgi:hypothetical protein
MSTTPAQGLWIGSGDGTPARERVRLAIASLTRARRLQHMLDYAFAGLLVGLIAATAAVLAASLVPLPFSRWQITAVALVVGIAAALSYAWYRRPDALDVAIRADVALRLKQRLSTAWEFMGTHADTELAERLAAQAVKAGLPARAGLVFPLRVNRWGQLAPLAATLLLLVSVLDFERIRSPAPRAIDERVVSEGQRLSAFGREMHARATREQLPHSVKQAEQIERTATRMQSGALSRNESLGMLRSLAKSLDEAQTQAAAGKEAKPIAGTPLERRDGTSSTAVKDAKAALERMLERMPDGDAKRALKRYLDDAARSGGSRRTVEDALSNQHAIDKEELRELLQKLAQIERARREQEELMSAREQVDLAQANLGEVRVGKESGRGLAIDSDDEDSEQGDSASSSGTQRRFSGETRGATRYGAQSDSSVSAEREPAAALAEAARSGRILKPQAQVRAGEELVTQGQVLPRTGRPSVENVPMKAEYAAQVEQVLSREQYPTHAKEFVRRYFLSLSRGAQAPADETRGER